tara:strand:- start:312 stop:548 length:237 start_codon:yes stop_codon:yes gene_type:complete
MGRIQSNKKYLSVYLEDGLLQYLNLIHEAYCDEVEQVSRNFFCVSLLEEALDRMTVSIEESENSESISSDFKLPSPAT